MSDTIGNPYGDRLHDPRPTVGHPEGEALPAVTDEPAPPAEHPEMV